MEFNKPHKSKNSLRWTLLIFFVTYWFILFPIIWFVIQPALFKETNLICILYAMLFVALFILLLCIIYCCFKRRQNRQVDKEVQEIFRKLDTVQERPASIKAPYFTRKNRPVSKRVSIPTVPVVAKDADVKYTLGDANSDSTITIPLYFNDDRDVDKSKYVTQQELYFDGASFLGTGKIDDRQY
uniref:Chaperone protein dnaK2 n=1 Tax=Zeugodacus cucurbitae TaxID=28588 RepID=A0A0A1XDX1_ZEUCU